MPTSPKNWPDKRFHVDLSLEQEKHPHHRLIQGEMSIRVQASERGHLLIRSDKLDK